jgi:hypothetical protein
MIDPAAAGVSARVRALRRQAMTTRGGSFRRLAAAGLLGLSAVALPAPARQSDGEAPQGDQRPRDGRVQAYEAVALVALRKQKAQLELEVLQAQVDAKKAEILRLEAEARIRQITPTLTILNKLEAPVDMRFANETPLEDVLKYIKSATKGPNDAGIPIYVDPLGLQKAEKTMTSPVTIDLEGVTLNTSLRLVLKQLGLTYRVQGRPGDDHQRIPVGWAPPTDLRPR